MPCDAEHVYDHAARELPKRLAKEFHNHHGIAQTQACGVAKLVDAPVSKARSPKEHRFESARTTDYAEKGSTSALRVDLT